MCRRAPVRVRPYLAGSLIMALALPPAPGFSRISEASRISWAATSKAAGGTISGAAISGAAISRAAAGSPPAPRLVVEAPFTLRGAAAQVRAVPLAELAAVTRLMGLADPGPPIWVRLEPEGTAAALAVPSWISGYAFGGAGVVVLFPARAPSYPDSSLEDLLRHEVAHVLAARAAGGNPLPRWFDEGLAMIAGGTWGPDDRARFLLELLVDREVPLADLDRRFAGNERRVAGAYALAGAFVRDLVQRHGPAAPGRILAAIAAGAPFPEAFRATTGTTLAEAEAAFWRHHALRRWLPLVTSSTTLWLGITLLTLYAVKRRRRRDAALRAAWDEEDRVSQAVMDPPAPGSTIQEPKKPSRCT